MLKKLVYPVLFLLIVSLGFLLFFAKKSNIQAPEIGTACTADAKLCSDGTAVGRVPPNCDFPPCPGEEKGMRVSDPNIDETLSRPLMIKGEAIGPWFFEAQFSAELYGGDGKLLGTSTLTALTEWMTEEYVPFEGMMEYDQPSGNRGVLRFLSSNPSGLPENQKTYEMPVIFNL